MFLYNLKNMKQKIYILGNVTMFVVSAGLFLKVNHLAGSSIILPLGIITLLFIFLPLALINNYKAEAGEKSLMLYIVTWITCLILLTSMLFKILHWPLAGYLLMIALPLPFIFFLPVFLVVTSKIKNFNIYNTVFVLFLLASISVFSAFLALTVTRQKVENNFSISAEYTKVNNALKEFPGLKIGTSTNSLAIKVDELLMIVSNYKHLLSESASYSVDTRTQNLLGGDESKDMGYKVLLTDSEITLAVMLENKMIDFVNELDKTKKYSDLAKSVRLLFDLSESKDADMEWADKVFGNNCLQWIQIYLDSLELNLFMIKASIIS